MPREPDGKGPRPKLYEETLQVRVRKKNPLIERKRSGHANVTPPAAEPLTPTPMPREHQEPESSEVAGSIYDAIENTDRTEEVEVAGQELLDAISERGGEITPVDPQVYIEEEETVLAGGTPRAQEKWRAEVAEIKVQRSAKKTEKPTPAPLPRSAAQVAPVPRGRLGNIGTDAAAAEVHRQMIVQREQALPTADSPALKLLRAQLDQESLEALDKALAGDLDRRGVDPSLSPKRALEHLVYDKAFAELLPNEQASLLKAVVPDPRDVTTPKAAIALLKTGVLKRLKGEDRRRALLVFSALSPDGRARLAQVAARQVRGRSALEDRDLSDASLLEHLEKLAAPEAVGIKIEALGIRPRKIVGAVVSTLAQPERMSFEDGSAGVVGMLEFGLAEAAPAELARIWRGLVSAEMSVELAGKATLDLSRVDAARARDASSRPSPLRLAFESLPQLARSGGRQRRPTFIMPGGHGIDADVLSRALSLVWGVGYTVAAGHANCLRHLERVSKVPQRLPPVYLSVLSDRGERLFIFDHLEAEHAFVRAPHGKSSKRVGAVRIDPRREVVDPDKAIERIRLEDLSESCGVGLIPRA